jgi:hypothetical protein
VWRTAHEKPISSHQQPCGGLQENLQLCEVVSHGGWGQLCTERATGGESSELGKHPLTVDNTRQPDNISWTLLLGAWSLFHKLVEHRGHPVLFGSIVMMEGLLLPPAESCRTATATYFLGLKVGRANAMT